MTPVHEHAAHRKAFSPAGFAAIALSSLVYLFFLATFLYMIGFIADAPFLPKTIDSGAVGPPLQAVLIDLSLLGLFAVQHSVMARPAFKQWWTKIVPAPLERSAFVLAATALVVLLIWQWRPLPATMWNAPDPIAAGALWATFGAGWAVLLISTFLINHFELFGLHQAYALLVGRSFEPPAFKTPGLYRLVRHPLYLGFILAFWAAPHMSQGRLLFAAAATAYILVGIYFEERDLVAHFGEAYRRYQKRVPMLLPLGGRETSSRADRSRV
jgi:protein-S-isoprenylcysteine O-methyltransferase Ste14